MGNTIPTKRPQAHTKTAIYDRQVDLYAHTHTIPKWTNYCNIENIRRSPHIVRFRHHLNLGSLPPLLSPMPPPPPHHTYLWHLGALARPGFPDQHQSLVRLQSMQQVVAERKHRQPLTLLLQTQRHVRVVDEGRSLQRVGVRAVLGSARRLSTWSGGQREDNRQTGHRNAHWLNMTCFTSRAQ